MAETIVKVNGERFWAAPGGGRDRVLAGDGQEHPSSPAPQQGREVRISPATCPRWLSISIPWPSLWMSHLVPHHIPLVPSSFAGRMGSSSATVIQYFPFILAEADESGWKPGPAALPPPISPQTNPWARYQREKFSPPAKV